MKKYSVKITLEFDDETKIYYGLKNTTDDKIIADLIEKLILRQYTDMDEIKQAEEIILNSQLEYKTAELVNSIKDELNAFFKNIRPCNEHLMLESQFINPNKK